MPPGVTLSADLTSLLVDWQFWVLELQFAILLVMTGIEAPRLQLGRRVLVAAAALAIVATAIVTTLPPRTSRIYYDEQIYQGIGRSLAENRTAQMCNEGSVEYGRLHCERGIYNKQPHGYPYLLSVIYRLNGIEEAAAFQLNNVVAGVTVFVTVCLAALLFGNIRVAVLSGLLLALVPMHIVWSSTAAVEPTAAMFCAAAVLAAVHYSRTRTGTALAWAIAVTVFAMSFRPESALIAPLAGLVIVLLAPGELRTRRFWYGAAAGAVGAALPLAHLFAVRDVQWGTTGDRLSWEYLAANLPSNFWFYFGDERFPWLFGVSAVAALGMTAATRERLLLLVYFLMFWGVFLFFFAGSYNYGADVRYSLMSYVPLAVLGGAGLGRVASYVRSRWLPQWSDNAVVAAASAGIAFHFLSFTPLIRAAGEDAWAARADVKYAKAFSERLPSNSIVLTHNPGMFHIWGVDAAQLSIAATEPLYVEQRLFGRYAGGVYLHWNYWCNVDDPLQRSLCRKALDGFPSVLIDERHERDYRYALYRLAKPAAEERSTGNPR